MEIAYKVSFTWYKVVKLNTPVTSVGRLLRKLQGRRYNCNVIVCSHMTLLVTKIKHLEQTRVHHLKDEYKVTNYQQKCNIQAVNRKLLNLLNLFLYHQTYWTYLIVKKPI